MTIYDANLRGWLWWNFSAGFAGTGAATGDVLTMVLSGVYLVIALLHFRYATLLKEERRAPPE